MTNYQMLNNVAHKNLRVITRRGADLGDAVAACAVYPGEFNEIQKHYPILFQRTDEGRWLTICLLGFESNENLFLVGGSWAAPYIPAIIEREPFVIGMKETVDGHVEAMVNIDLANPRIARGEEGEFLFLPQGGNSAYLEKITRVLSLLHEGVSEVEAMLNEFERLELIEPIRLEITFANRTSFIGNRYATINKSRLLALPDNEIAQLHRNGMLRYAYLIIGSFSNIQALVDLKNTKLLQQS